ncbi:hypothetical protein [Flavobacterium sp. WC2509]|uniref:hypothetical protein n=1 Tax=Flavobacterium sp. WC2509 TaxID=3461406 RepID=UPI004045121A
MKHLFLTFILFLSTSFFLSCSEEKDQSIQATEVAKPNEAVEAITTTDPTKSRTTQKIANCQSASIHFQEYWLNNNQWGSSNAGSGTQCVWLDSQNSWGAYATHTGSNSSGIKGYPSMVFGTQGSVVTTTKLPKKISDLGNVHTWWTWTASGRAWNATYDIWFNNSDYELMVWMQWQNSWPMGNSLGVVYANVTLSGYQWNVYKKGNIFSFLLVNQQGWISMDVKPIINFCVSKGWIPSTASMSRIEAGWEIIDGGTFETSSFGISQI